LPMSKSQSQTGGLSRAFAQSHAKIIVTRITKDHNLIIALFLFMPYPFV
jgi:hypothetical protein